MKILWHGVPAEYPTGYGTQTRLFTRALKALGHEVVISSIVNGCFTYTDQNGIRVVVNGASARMGNAMIKEHVKRIQPDLLLTMFDTFVCEPSEYKDAPWVAWTIVDSQPLHPRLKRISTVPKALLAMSHFGQSTLEVAGFTSEYVPLAIDTTEYKYMDKAEARKQLSKAWGHDIPPFLAVVVAANMSKPSRKNFFGALKTWEGFCKNSKNLNDPKQRKPLLYIHTEFTGAHASGENILELADLCHMNPAVLMFPDQYRYKQSGFGTDYMRALYSAADVLLCSSLGEGFCLPLIEAQACGCPVIAPAATSTKELIGYFGTELFELSPVALFGASMQYLPNNTEMVAALERYRDKPIAANGRKRLADITGRMYDINYVAKQYLVPALAKSLVTVGRSRTAKPVVKKTVQEVAT